MSEFDIILPANYSASSGNVYVHGVPVGTCPWSTTHTYADTISCSMTEEPAGTDIVVKFLAYIGAQGPYTGDRLPDGAGADLYLHAVGDSLIVSGPFRMTGP